MAGLVAIVGTVMARDAPVIQTTVTIILVRARDQLPRVHTTIGIHLVIMLATTITDGAAPRNLKGSSHLPRASRQTMNGTKATRAQSIVHSLRHSRPARILAGIADIPRGQSRAISRYHDLGVMNLRLVRRCTQMTTSVGTKVLARVEGILFIHQYRHRAMVSGLPLVHPRVPCLLRLSPSSLSLRHHNNTCTGHLHHQPEDMKVVRLCAIHLSVELRAGIPMRSLSPAADLLEIVEITDTTVQVGLPQVPDMMARLLRTMMHRRVQAANGLRVPTGGTNQAPLIPRASIVSTDVTVSVNRATLTNVIESRVIHGIATMNAIMTVIAIATEIEIESHEILATGVQDGRVTVTWINTTLVKMEGAVDPNKRGLPQILEWAGEGIRTRARGIQGEGARGPFSWIAW